MESIEELSAHIRDLLGRMVRLDLEAELDPINFVVEEFSEFTVEAWRYFQYDKVFPELLDEAVDVIAASLTFLTSRQYTTMSDEMLDNRIQASVESTVGSSTDPGWMPTFLYCLRSGAIFSKTACKLRRDKATEQDLISADIDLVAAAIIFLCRSGLTVKDIVSKCSFKYNRALDRWYTDGEK